MHSDGTVKVLRLKRRRRAGGLLWIVGVPHLFPLLRAAVFPLRSSIHGRSMGNDLTHPRNSNRTFEIPST